MAKFRINPESLKNVQAKIDAYGKKTEQRFKLALLNWAIDVVAEMQKELLEVNAIDQGILSAATTNTPVTQIGSVLKVTVYNNLEYAPVVEWGRHPGSGKPPPLLPIVGWAGRKGLISHVPRNISFGGEWAKEWAASGAILKNIEKGGGHSTKKSKPMDPVVHDLLIVRLIAKKIFEKGIAGRHPFSKAWDRKAATFKQDIAAMVQ